MEPENIEKPAEDKPMEISGAEETATNEQNAQNAINEETTNVEDKKDSNAMDTTTNETEHAEKQLPDSNEEKMKIVDGKKKYII